MPKLPAAFAAAALVALSTSASGLGGEVAWTRACPVTSGPTYKFPNQKPANAYRLAVVGGVQCSFAIQWMRRLANEPIRRLPTPLPGPPGWKCTAVHQPGLRLKAYTGRCQNGARVFTWSPRFSPGE